MSTNEPTQTGVVKSQKTKKRKRDDKSDIDEKPRSKARKSAKKPNAHESKETYTDKPTAQLISSDSHKDGSQLPPLQAPPDKPSRFIVFVGNLPYSCSTNTIEKHFLKVKPAKVRHITDKDNGKSKGYAFLEFEGYDRMKTCLNSYHGTTVKGRKIRVELTAGGGGAKSQVRRDKIAAKNLRLNGQRFRREQEELGERSKDGDERKTDKRIGSKAEKVQSKAKNDKKAVKKGSEKIAKSSADVNNEKAPGSNSDVHPSRRKLVTH